MSEQFKNLAATQLDGEIDDSTTSVVVDSAMGFTGGNFRIRIDNEIMKVTGVSDTTLTVVRHQEGTTATSHADNAAVYHILTAGALDARIDDLVIYDPYANKPAAGVAGRLFLPSDGIFFERDNGAAWEKFGPLWPMTPPQVADFPNWVNQGAATIADSFGAIFMVAPAQASSSLRIVTKAYPTPPFTVEAAFIACEHCQYDSSEIAAGICIRESGTGKLQVYGKKGGSFPNSVGLNYANPTASGSGITGWSGSGKEDHWTAHLVWVKYVDDTSHRIISMSQDGLSWGQMVSLATNDTFTPDQIGLVVNNVDAGTETQIGATFLHWRQY